MNGIPSSTYFSAAPDWGWLVVLYFFFGGLAGGCYFLASLIALFGRPEDRPLSHLGYYIPFPCVLLSALLLILDLQRPLRFWHMLIESNTFQPIFKYWSPMSLGSWALLIFGIFSLVSFLGALADANHIPWAVWRNVHPPSLLGRFIAAIGGLFGFYVAGYTGVLLAVTNRPIWSDTPLLGHAVYRFGRIHIGGIDDSAGGEIPVDHAWSSRLASHGCVADRIGIHRLDRSHDISRSGTSRVAECLGPVASYRRRHRRHASTSGTFLASAVARGLEHENDRCSYPSRWFPSPRGDRLLGRRSMT